MWNRSNNKIEETINSMPLTRAISTYNVSTYKRNKYMNRYEILIKSASKSSYFGHFLSLDTTYSIDLVANFY